MNRCCRCSPPTDDYVSVKQFNGLTGEFNWEILNLDNYHDLMNPVYDGGRYLYVDFTRAGDSDQYEQIWGKLTYPTVVTLGSQSIDFRYSAYDYSDQQGEYITEQGIHKIDLQSGEVIYSKPMIFTISHNRTIQGIDQSNMNMFWVPNGGFAGDYCFVRKGNVQFTTEIGYDQIFGLNAADPTTEFKTYILSFGIKKVNKFNTNTGRIGSVWRFTAPAYNSFPEMSVDINEFDSLSTITGQLSSLPHIKNVTGSGSLLSGGYIIKIEWMDKAIVNFSDIKQVLGSQQTLTSVDRLILNMVTGEVIPHFNNDYRTPAPPPFQSKPREAGVIPFGVSRGDQLLTRTTSLGETVVSVVFDGTSPYFGIDIFKITNSSLLLVDSLELDYTAYVKLLPPFGTSFLPPRISLSVDLNDEYLSLFHDVLIRANGLFEDRPIGHIITLSDLSNRAIDVSDSGGLNIYLIQDSSCQLIGNTNSFLLSSRITNIEKWDSSTNSTGTNYSLKFSNYQLFDPDLVWATNKHLAVYDGQIKMLSDKEKYVSIGRGTDNFNDPVSAGFGGEILYSKTDREPDYSENLEVSRGKIILQQKFRIDDSFTGELYDYYIYGVLLPKNSWMNENCRWRIVFSNNSTKWFFTNDSYSEVQSELDRIFGFNTFPGSRDGNRNSIVETSIVEPSENQLVTNDYIYQPGINSHVPILTSRFNNVPGQDWNLVWSNFSFSTKVKSSFNYVSVLNNSNILDKAYVEFEQNIPESAQIRGHDFRTTDNDILWSRNIGLAKGKKFIRNRTVYQANPIYNVDQLDNVTFVFPNVRFAGPYPVGTVGFKENDPRVEPGTLNGNVSVYNV